MILKGKPVADAIKEELTKKVTEYRERGIAPKLAILRVGDQADDIAYERRILKNCEAVGITAEVTVFNEKITTEELLNRLECFNQDTEIHGILIFRPLPKQIEEEKIGAAIDPRKDVDSMNPINVQKVMIGDCQAVIPCTAEAVMRLLHYYEYPLQGKQAVIVNRSLVIGKPLSMLLLAENATVTICHSKSEGMKEILSKADLVVTGVGKANFFDETYFSDKNTIVDVGINFDNSGMCGDVDFGKVENQVRAITPVPGGIGGVTSTILLEHVLKGISSGCLIK